MSRRELLLILGSMILLIPMLSYSVSGLTCEGCHTSSNPSGGYVYEGPLISVIHDPYYSPGEDFDSGRAEG